jgi:hypothetical protein
MFGILGDIIEDQVETAAINYGLKTIGINRGTKKK